MVEGLMDQPPCTYQEVDVKPQPEVDGALHKAGVVR